MYFCSQMEYKSICLQIFVFSYFALVFCIILLYASVLFLFNFCQPLFKPFNGNTFCMIHKQLWDDRSFAYHAARVPPLPPSYSLFTRNRFCACFLPHSVVAANSAFHIPLSLSIFFILSHLMWCFICCVSILNSVSMAVIYAL